MKLDRMEYLNSFYSTVVKSSHPLLLSIYLLNKTLPVILYVIGSWFLDYTQQFILIMLLLSLDFYLTKNIHGRKLVQLRWWYDVNNSGDGHLFKFESYKEYQDLSSDPINPIDSKIFWWSIYLCPIIWTLFALICILKLQLVSLLLVVLAIGLNGWNCYGFHCCEKWEPNNNKSIDSWLSVPNFQPFNILNPFTISRVRSLF